MQASHFVGAMNELIAAQYFLGKGCQVYFPVVQQGPIDFVVQEGSEFLRVQVKTATWSNAGGWSYLQCRTRSTNKFQHEPKDNIYDVLAVVYENELWFIPSNEIQSSNISLRGTHANYRVGGWDKYKVL